MSKLTDDSFYPSQGYLKPLNIKNIDKNENLKPPAGNDNESGHYEEIENYTNLSKNHENIYNELNFSKTKVKSFLKSLTNTRKKLFILVGILITIGLISLIAIILPIVFTTSNTIFL